MIPTIDELWKTVHAQSDRVPSLYGGIDFRMKPERFSDELEVPRQPDDPWGHLRAKLFADQEKVERIRAYTMMGDPVADAYAALMPKYGFRALIGMLTQACAQGVESVENPPEELVSFIKAMEVVPDWIDMNLVREGARFSRNEAANVSPYIIRGSFIGTFMNKYSALPMALTGQLSNETSARRVRETATFFSTSVLPGALERHGAGFQAAAMVRLMHSMVRFNALKRSKLWDLNVYGIPVPQIDAMPAGLLTDFIRAFTLLAKGRTEYTHEERARLELSRYRCFLLGLNEDLLPVTPQALADLMMIRDQTIRRAFDDKICGSLVRATLDAYLPLDHSLSSRISNYLEHGFAKIFFLKVFMVGDVERAKRMGITFSRSDRFCFAVMGAYVGIRVVAFKIAESIPGIRGLADRLLVRRIKRILTGYGHAEFASDGSAYKSTAGNPNDGNSSKAAA